jgi:fumarate reductase flavoprotein subunit
MIAAGAVRSADTVERLAEEIGLPPEGLAATVARYNDDVDDGVDALYGKHPRFLRDLRKPPFYATELRLAHLAVTGAGLRIDADARVLDCSSRPVPGLFASGECTGGILGDVYVGSGNSLTNGLVFGQVAAETAMAGRDGAAS